MEHYLLHLLEFDVNLPTRDFFATRLFEAVDVTERESHLLRFLLELSLLVSIFRTLVCLLILSFFKQ